MTAEELVARYQTAYGHLRAATVARVTALWLARGGPGDGNVDAFTVAAVPLVLGAQAATARLVAGYIAMLTRLVEEEAATPAAVSDVAVDVIRGVAAAEVYARPVITMRAALAEGKQFAEALELGRQRAEQIADTDIALAQREATVQAIGADERIVGYRRVLTGRSCSFCATASTQRYRKAQLMPIHGRCDCGVAPIFGTSDPGQVINKPLRRDLKAAAKATDDPTYYKNRHITVDEDGNVKLPDIKVHRHGELGPVLSDASHAFAGPSVAA